MDKNCSLFGLGSICCGENRGASNLVNLNECQQDVEVHLSSCHLSRSNLKEYVLILLRAELFHVTGEQLNNMNICPSHRNKLGKFWRPLRSCQYTLNIVVHHDNVKVETLSMFSFQRQCLNYTENLLK